MNSLRIDKKAIVLSIDMSALMYSDECYILVYHRVSMRNCKIG